MGVQTSGAQDAEGRRGGGISSSTMSGSLPKPPTSPPLVGRRATSEVLVPTEEVFFESYSQSIHVRSIELSAKPARTDPDCSVDPSVAIRSGFILIRSVISSTCAV